LNNYVVYTRNSSDFVYILHSYFNPPEFTSFFGLVFLIARFNSLILVKISTSESRWVLVVNFIFGTALSFCMRLSKERGTAWNRGGMALDYFACLAFSCLVFKKRLLPHVSPGWRKMGFPITSDEIYIKKCWYSPVIPSRFLVPIVV
jgi:hypothetical protein